MVYKGVILIAMSGLMSACRPDTPISSLHRSDITRVTLADCADRQFPISEQDIIDRFWEAIASARNTEPVDLKLHTGYGRAWVHFTGHEKPIYLEMVASLVHGPVIVYGSHCMLCDKCEGFFTELRNTHPGFNWCQAPMVQ